MPLATSWALPALCKSDTGFQFPATTLDFLRFRHKVSLFLRVNHCVGLNTHCFAGVKKGLFIFACEFVDYIPTRRKNAISMLST